MKRHDWDDEKSRKLAKERGVCFEDVVVLIEQGFVLAIIDHPNAAKYPNQKMYIINVNGYVHVVPFVENGQTVYLKTIFPSRKLTKFYLGGNA